MKRFIAVGIRPNKDKETGDELLFITLYRLPSKMKNGGLWHPKKDEAIVNACVNKSKDIDCYNTFSKVLPGTLVDVTFGLNDFNGKTFVAKMDIVPDTNFFDETQVYI